jgi:molybdopterin-guanine dinucleotide biosynthesis protein A
LGGILTALQNTSAHWNLIVACDMPNVSAAFLRQLLDAAEAWDVDALLPAGPSHQLEPLCAVYHRRTRRALEAAFSGGQRKVMAALEGLPVAVLLVAERAPLQNVNTPADWATYARG